MLLVVWKIRHHEALLIQSNNCNLLEKAILSLSTIIFRYDLPLYLHIVCLWDRYGNALNRREIQGYARALETRRPERKPLRP
jgi:hypothetical protein